MKKSIYFLPIALLTALSALTFGCGKETAAVPAEPDTMQWEERIDGKKYRGSIKIPPQRAVSVSQATTEMLLALGVDGQMAGTAFLEEEIAPSLADAYHRVPVLAQQLPSYSTLSAFSPDIIIGAPTAFGKKGIPVEQLMAEKIPIYIPDSLEQSTANLADVAADMERLGELFAAADAAQAWREENAAKRAELAALIDAETEAKIFIYNSGEQEPYTAFRGYAINILQYLGAKPALEPKGETIWGKVKWEEVAAARPDYIIIIDYGKGDDRDYNRKVDHLLVLPALADVPAVRNEAFLRVTPAEITPGVRTVDMLLRLANEMNTIREAQAEKAAENAETQNTTQ